MGEREGRRAFSHCILLRGANEDKRRVILMRVKVSLKYTIYNYFILYIYKEYCIRHCKQCLTLFYASFLSL